VLVIRKAVEMKKRGVAVLRNVGHGVNDIYWYILPSLLPQILEQFDLRYKTAGGLLTAYLGVIALFSFILGKLSDYLPRQKVLGAGFLVASLFLILSGLTRGISLFIVCILIAGIGVSSFHPAAYALIDDTTMEKHGNAYGMFEFWGAVAVFFMFVLHGFLLKTINWRSIIVITSVPGVVMGVLYISYTRRFVQNPLPGDLWTKGNTKVSAGDFHSTDHWSAEQRDLHQKPGSSQETPISLFILFLLIVTFRFFGMIAVVNFTPTFLVREIGLQTGAASYATGIYFIGGMIFTPAAGRLCDRWRPFPVLLLTTGVVAPLIILMSVVSQSWLLACCLLLIGACYYGAGPPQNMLIARMSGRIGKGEAFGYFMAVIGVTFSFSPFLFGISADRTGLSESMRIFSIPILLSFFILIVLSMVMKNRTKLKL